MKTTTCLVLFYILSFTIKADYSAFNCIKEKIILEYKDSVANTTDDYFAVIEKLICNENDTLLQTNVVFASTLFSDTLICENFLPLEKISYNRQTSINDKLHPFDIIKTKKGFDLALRKEDIPLSKYKRIISFQYDKKKKDFEILKDGGVGVWSYKTKYVSVRKIAKERIYLKNFTEWYSWYMLSDTTTLQNKRVFVNNEDDFFKNISDNKTLIVKAKQLDVSLSKVKELYKPKLKIKIDTISRVMGVVYNDSAWWIDHVSNLSIIGSQTSIESTKSKYAFWIDKVNNLNLSNLKFSNIGDANADWILCISNSDKVAISNCSLNNGSMGLFVYNTVYTTVKNTSIQNTKSYAILLRKSNKIDFFNCNIFKANDVVQIQNSSGRFLDCSFFNNKYFYLLFLDGNSGLSKVEFRNCKEYKNVKRYWDDGYKIGYENYFGLDDLDDVQNINSGYVLLKQD